MTQVMLDTWLFFVGLFFSCSNLWGPETRSLTRWAAFILVKSCQILLFYSPKQQQILWFFKSLFLWRGSVIYFDYPIKQRTQNLFWRMTKGVIKRRRAATMPNSITKLKTSKPYSSTNEPWFSNWSSTRLINRYFLDWFESIIMIKNLNNTPSVPFLLSIFPFRFVPKLLSFNKYSN